jgi:site-specific DNA recombinase
MLGILCRISQEKEDGKDRSIKEQQELGKKLAKKLNLPFEFYIEEGVSGTLPIAKRPHLDRLLSDIEDGRITSMYIWMQDRLERNPQTRFIVKQTLIDKGCKLFTEEGEVDFDNDATDMHGDMMSIFNAYYVRTTRKRVKAVLKRNAEEGRAHGISPFGYTKDANGTIIIDDEEASIVRQIYKMSLSGIGTNKIAETFNLEGILTRYNKIGKGTLSTKNKYTGRITTSDKKSIKWSGNTIRNIIKNTIYKGDRNFGGNIYKVPAIFDSSEWQKVNDNLKNNRNNSGKNVSHKYLLKGKIRCGVCGRNYYGRSRVSLKDNFYMCSSKRLKHENCGNRSINIPVLDALVWKRFLYHKDLSDVLKEHIEKGNDKNILDQIEQEISLCDIELKRLEKERTKTIQFALKEIIDEKELKNNLRRINGESKDYELKKEKAQLQLKSYDKENLIKMQSDLRHLHKSISYNDRLDIITKFVREISIAKFNGVYYRVKIEFNLPMEYIEDWHIDRNLNFAIHLDRFIFIIPLNKKFKDKLEADDAKAKADDSILSPETNVRLKIHEDFLEFYNVQWIQNYNES